MKQLEATVSQQAKTIRQCEATIEEHVMAISRHEETIEDQEATLQGVLNAMERRDAMILQLQQDLRIARKRKHEVTSGTEHSIK